MTLCHRHATCHLPLARRALLRVVTVVVPAPCAPRLAAAAADAAAAAAASASAAAAGAACDSRRTSATAPMTAQALQKKG